MFFGKKPPVTETSQGAGEPTAMAQTPTPPTEPPAAPAAEAAPGAEPGLSDEERRKRIIAAKQLAASFGEIVMLLMRSPVDKFQSLQDLEWLVAPALVRGQFAVADAQSKETGVVIPVAAVLWAYVSEEVDARLSTHSGDPLRLTPAEWRSGDIPWIILTIGDPKVLGGLLNQLTRTVFKERAPKLRIKGADGNIVVGRLEVTSETPSQT